MDAARTAHATGGLSAAHHGVDLLENGDFERGDLTGWEATARRGGDHDAGARRRAWAACLENATLRSGSITVAGRRLQAHGVGED